MVCLVFSDKSNIFYKKNQNLNLLENLFVPTTQTKTWENNIKYFSLSTIPYVAKDR